VRAGRGLVSGLSAGCPDVFQRAQFLLVPPPLAFERLPLSAQQPRHALGRVISRLDIGGGNAAHRSRCALILDAVAVAVFHDVFLVDCCPLNFAERLPPSRLQLPFCASL